MPRILCVYLPNWPVQRLLVACPELAPAQPIVLHARDPRRGELVFARSAAAEECGVRRGMPLAEAAALLSHCPASCLRRHEPVADWSTLARLAEHCERFSPLVGWQTVEPKTGDRQAPSSRTPRGKRDAGPSAEHLFLDVTGIGILFGGEKNLARELVAEFARLGYRVRIALAGTIGAAWAICHDTLENFSILPSEATQDVVGPFPLAALRLPEETANLLAQLGIERIEQLLKLPRESLASRFGKRLLLRLDQLLGNVQELVVPHAPPPKFVVEEILEYPRESRDCVEQIVRQLVERLALLLAERRQGALRLACRLDCAPGRPLLLSVGLFSPSADPRHLWSLLRMRLEQTTLSGPVGRITLAVPLAAPLHNRQQELFASEGHDSRELHVLIDRLSSRLGAKAVLRAELTADPLPERGVRLTPLVEGRKKGAGKSSVPPPLHRPLRLYSPPRRLEVVSSLPEGHPISFQLHRQTCRVVRWWGPERIESGWWRGRSVRRDYYRVETEEGKRYWLFRQLGDGAWLLHGEFA